jgi:hypothetical protein
LPHPALPLAVSKCLLCAPFAQMLATPVQLNVPSTTWTIVKSVQLRVNDAQMFAAP